MRKNYFVLLLAMCVSLFTFAQEVKKEMKKENSGPSEYGRAHFLGIRPSIAQQINDGTIIYGNSKSGILNDKKNVKPKSWSSPQVNGDFQTASDPSVRQTEAASSHQRMPILDFEAHVVNGFAPSDPTGAAGPNHYITAINGSEYSIWNLD